MSQLIQQPKLNTDAILASIDFTLWANNNGYIPGDCCWLHEDGGRADEDEMVAAFAGKMGWREKRKFVVG